MRALRRVLKRRKRKEIYAEIEKWQQRRDSAKAQKYDLQDVPGVNMAPLDNAIEHADRMVQFYQNRINELDA